MNIRSQIPSHLRLMSLVLILSVTTVTAADRGDFSSVMTLPVAPTTRHPATDYLLDGTPFRAAAYRQGNDELVLDNGLVRRTWRLQPNGACVAFDNLMTGQAMLRAVRPEARLTVDGVAYDIGGLVGPTNQAYLSSAARSSLKRDDAAWRLVDVTVGKPVARFPWLRRRHAAPTAQWPPPGVSVRFDYAPPNDSLSARVAVHYELYDGVPVMCKWITLHNSGAQPLRVDRFRGEELAVVEHSNWVDVRDAMPVPDCLHVETDYAFGGFNPEVANQNTVQWRDDPAYTTQVNYLLKTPCLLVVEPDVGPAQSVAPDEVWEGFRVFELAYDNGDRERRSLALRRMYRTIAPWVTENPLTHHLLSNNPDQVRQAVDYAAEVGFEAIILSFGSGFDMEHRDPAHLRTWREVADYAEQGGIELGSYSLFSSRHVGDEHMIVSPAGQSPTHGQCPAVTSAWGQQWLATVRDFYQATGFDQFENDGPYPGDIDTTARPPLQAGELDSRWVQWRMTAQLYHDLRAQGVYINAPDYYYLSGSNKCGMGYREVNWSLPRAEQVIHTRQNIYDGTWSKTPSMGWMFVPLSQYHGGGAAATIEPLDQHRDHYRLMMLSNLGCGVQAHYRGPRLFDTPATRAMVADTIAWFKQYRELLESDIIHGRRADGRDLDWVLHANAQLDPCGLLCVYNPLPEAVTRELVINLYYTGLVDHAALSHEGSEPLTVDINSRDEARLEVTVPAQGMTWYLIRAPHRASSTPAGP